MSTFRPIKRTVKANLVSPEIFAFTFDSDVADGYTASGGVTVEMDADGVYTCTLPTSFKDANVLWADAKVAEDTANTAVVSSQSTGDGVIEVQTLTSGTATLLSDKTIQVVLLLKGG